MGAGGGLNGAVLEAEDEVVLEAVEIVVLDSEAPEENEGEGVNEGNIVVAILVVNIIVLTIALGTLGDALVLELSSSVRGSLVLVVPRVIIVEGPKLTVTTTVLVTSPTAIECLGRSRSKLCPA